MKKVFRILLPGAVALSLLTGCSVKQNEVPTSKPGVDIYVSDDVDVFGNKIENGDKTEIKPGKEHGNSTSSPSGDVWGEEPPAHELEEAHALEELKVYFIDVGQADCILLRFADEDILIDGGNNADGDDIVSYLKHLGVENITAMVGTHPHEDHIGGLDDVIAEIPTDQIYLPYVAEQDVPTTKTYKDLLQAVSDGGLIVNEAKNGDVIYQTNSSRLEIISPDNVSPGDLNDYSIVLKLTYGDVSFMFTGDASVEVNEAMINQYGEDYLDIDVLKVGHHGSRTATDSKWVDVTTPEYSVIMCEEGNSYGHPHKEAMQALEGKTNILRTDEDGTILFSTDGTKVEIDTKLTGDIPLGHKDFSIDDVK